VSKISIGGGVELDAKKLLYKYKQFGEAKNTAEKTIRTLQERHKRQGVDENWWIRSNIPKNTVETDFIEEEDILGKIRYLEWVISELDRITDATQRAVKTLNKEQQEIIELRYFEGQTVTYICEKINAKNNKYSYLHRTALEAMQTVLNPLCISDEYLDMLLFSPYGERMKEVSR
jgi:DNA-directed RNA polymerase specialized sigma subunit